jgi:hypothetical protein
MLEEKIEQTKCIKQNPFRKAIKSLKLIGLGLTALLSAYSCSGSNDTNEKANATVSDTSTWGSGFSQEKPDTYSSLKPETSSEGQYCYKDFDGDSIGSSDSGILFSPTGSCPESYSTKNGDCDDKNPNRIYDCSPKSDTNTANSDVMGSSTQQDAQSGCQPNCNGKECGNDGCGGSCGGCGTGEGCLSSGKCSPYTDEEILAWGECALTDSIKFSYSEPGHNLQYNDMKSANYACANSEGIVCKEDAIACWAQWDMAVNKNSDWIMLKLEGQIYASDSFYGQIDYLPFGDGFNNNDTDNKWNLHCKAGLSSEGAIKTTFNGINFTSDGTVTFQFSCSGTSNLLSYAQIYSCTYPTD